MRTHGVFPLVRLLLVPLALATGCSTVTERSAGTGPVLRGGLGQARVRSIRMQLGQAENRIRELEAALAEQSTQPASARIATLEERERELSVELQRAKQESDSLRADLADARAAATAATAAAGRVGASPQLASLQVELESERSRRIDAEEKMAKLLEETSGSPFENASQTALNQARDEIAKLTDQLAAERGARGEAERRFADLQVQIDARPEPIAGQANSELTELQEEQRRLMASIQQDLEASRRREDDLRQTIATLHGEGAAPLTDQVKNLAAENQALQASLDTEHERNVELAAKLEVATRVADLIFKMRRDGRLPDTNALDAAVGE